MSDDGQPEVLSGSSDEALFARTGNPVYVWKVIAQLRMNAMFRAMEAEKPPSPEDIVDAFPDTLPPWIMRYLADAASGVWHLVQGIDQEFLFREGRRGPELPFKQSLARVPEALGLRKGTRNAIYMYHSDRGKIRDLYRYEELLEDGLKAGQAEARLMDEIDMTEVKALRRRLSEARKLLGRGTKLPR